MRWLPARPSAPAGRAGRPRETPPWTLPSWCQHWQCGQGEGEPGAVPALRALRVGGRHPTGSQPLLSPGGVCWHRGEGPGCVYARVRRAGPRAQWPRGTAPRPLPPVEGSSSGWPFQGEGGEKGRRLAPIAPPSAALRPSAGFLAASPSAGPPAASVAP